MSDSEDDYGGYFYPNDHYSGGGGGGGGGGEYDGYSSSSQEEDDYGGKYLADKVLDPEEGDHSISPPSPRELVKAYSRPNFGSYETKNTSKFQCKDHEEGKDYSAKFSKAYKAQDFLDKHTGNPGFKEETKYDVSYKVDDKIGGSITEYRTQVKTSKKVTDTNHPPSKDYINIEKSSSSHAAPSPTMPPSFKHLSIK